MIVKTLLALAVVVSAFPATVPAAVPAYTHELALNREPKPFPFTAIYSKGRKRLGFVAARHEDGNANPSATAIRAAFASLEPDFVILEGFPTELGESPAAIVSIALSRGKPGATPFARSEAMLAASIAIGGRIPFIGGEPNSRQQITALTRDGFSPADILFADTLKTLSQFIRSGQVTGPADPRFATLYQSVSETLAHSHGEPPMLMGEFERRYRTMFGIEASADAEFVNRPVPSTVGLVGRILTAEMQVRDQALLSLIMDAFKKHQRVLVVYGGSHWTTLSGNLEREFGKPKIV